MIKHRRVIYVHGYDPQGAEGYYGLFRHGWKRFKDVWKVKSDLGALQFDSDELASWTVTTSGPDWQVVTEYEFVRYEDILESNLKRPIGAQVFAALHWMLDDLFSGTTARIIRASWRFEIHHAVFQLMLVAWIGIALAGGVLAGLALARTAGVPVWAAIVIGAAVAAAFFRVLRPLAERLFCVRINNHWPHLRRFGRGEPTCFERPIETGVARLMEAANARDADEILLVGHSGGCPLVLGIAARALARDPDIGRRGGAIVVLTLGSITPAVALHPRAAWMRDVIRRLAVEPSLQWIDCQSRKDILNFWNFDPVAGVGVDAGAQRCDPLLWQVRFRDVLTEERYRKMQANFFRLHYQFIMAGDQRAGYDYFMLTGGPVAAADWARQGEDIAAAFGADGAYQNAPRVSRTG